MNIYVSKFSEITLEKNFFRKVVVETIRLYKVKNIINSPPIFCKTILYGKSICPRSPAKIPKTKNVIKNPRQNKVEFLTALVLSPAEIKATNPGTSGNVHGARNINMPAKNEVMMLIFSITILF